MKQKQYSYIVFVGLPVFALLIMLGISGFYLKSNVFSLLMDVHQERMRVIVEGVGQTFIQYEGNLSDSKIRSIIEHYSQISRNRITVVEQDGQIIEDSSVPAGSTGSLSNHADREEIMDALKNEKSIHTRISTVTKKEMSYVAALSSLNGRPVVIRISRTTKDIRESMAPLLYLVIGFGVISLFGLAGVAILAIIGVNRRVRNEYKTRAAQVYSMQELGTLLSACASREEILGVVEKLFPELLHKMSGAIALFNSSRNQLEIKVEWGEQWAASRMYSPSDCWSLRKGREHNNKEGHRGVSCMHLTGVEENHYCFPMIAHGDTLGVLHVKQQSADGLSPEEKNFIFAISEQVGLALANANLRRNLRDQATKDALTGLHNRRYLMDTVVQEISRAERHDKILGVLMLDLDHFKNFNDTYGHDCGDKVLIRLGEALKKCTREHDICCRYGGEEFTIILVENSLEGMATVAKRICQAVRDIEFPYGNEVIKDITISIGISVFPHHGKSLDDLMKEADNMLYEVKKEGRDGFKMLEVSTKN